MEYPKIEAEVKFEKEPKKNRAELAKLAYKKAVEERRLKHIRLVPTLVEYVLSRIEELSSIGVSSLVINEASFHTRNFEYLNILCNEELMEIFIKRIEEEGFKVRYEVFDRWEDSFLLEISGWAE